MADHSAQHDVRCQEWRTFLETLRSNPNYPQQDDLKFGADKAAHPPAPLLAAAAHFGLNLKTTGGMYLLMLILADVVFRPASEAKKGRPEGSKKWDQRKLAKLGMRVALIEARN